MTAPSHGLGETLLSARERKGVDLARAERDTKIRARYLSALERGSYRELPGPVYTKGFLRNYGVYLGLDPEYLVDLYRLETGALAPERPAPVRRPRVARSRALVVTPAAVGAVALTALVAVVIAYLAVEFATFAGTPMLEVTDPRGDVGGHPEREYTVRGLTEPNSIIRVEGLRENPEGRADAEGNFEITVNLVPGPNVITLVASDPRTNRNSAPVSRTITVATALSSPVPEEAVALTLAEPLAGATASGSVTVAGEASGETVQVTATLVEPLGGGYTITDGGNQPVPSPSPSGSTVEPLALTVEAGRFAGALTVPPGVWDVTVTLAPPEAAPLSETRRVTVAPPSGLSVRLEVRGGPSYLEVTEDGVVDQAISFRNAADGADIELAAERTITIRAGSAGAVNVTVNGVRIGPMGQPGAVVTWTIARGP